MSGLPPSVGAISNGHASGDGGAARGRGAVIALSTLLNAGYFLPIVWRAFFVAPHADGGPAHGEAPWPMVLALTITAALTLLLFFVPDVPLALARQLVATAG